MPVVFFPIPPPPGSGCRPVARHVQPVVVEIVDRDSLFGDRRYDRDSPSPAVSRSGRWRAVDPDVGDLVLVCPRCWPRAARAVRGRVDLTVRELLQPPSWARCAVCEPEDSC